MEVISDCRLPIADCKGMVKSTISNQQSEIRWGQREGEDEI
jgi:hypothetical protein